MKCEECLDVLRTLPGARPDALPADAKAHLEECPRCRSRFQALVMLEQGTGLRAEPPAGLAEAILDKVAGAERATVMSWTQRPVLRWMPFAAAAALMIALGSFLAGYVAGGRGVAQQMVKVHLTLEAPSAVQVAVVGDWNGWNPSAQPMKRQDGKWELTLQLERGRSYQYQFLIDGKEWVPDPNNLVRVDNGFGGKNSLIGS